MKTYLSKNNSITKSIKLRLVNAFVFPVGTYASETWTLKKADQKIIEAFEM